MNSQVQDDAFHEIQLNGKQLVFLFMAATVVSVVIFLCGVLVGRGVRAERAGITTENAGTQVEPPPALPPAAAPAPGSQAQAQDPSTAPPPVPAEDRALSYFDRLEKGSSSEALKAPAPEHAAAATQARAAQPRATSTAPPPAPVPAPKAVAAAPKPAATLPKDVAPAPAAASAAGRDGYAIQVAALRESGEADTIAKRLVSKGYDAYVLTPPDGTPNVYRVRVGSFRTRRDAEATAAKLQQEEQFKPWITR